MGKRISPTLIGAFVVGAVVLALVGVTVFGSGSFFREPQEFVIYFTRSVNGLRVGAPVKFKGVEIGAVERILLRLGKGTLRPEEVPIPVIISIDADRIAAQTEGAPLGTAIEDLVRLGLRATLATESFVTGVLYVELDFLPSVPPRTVGDESSGYMEIPTVPTALERVQMQAAEFLMKLSEADVEGFLASLKQAVDGVNDLVHTPQLKAALVRLDGTVQHLDDVLLDARRLAHGLETEVAPFGRRLRATADKADASLDGVRVLLAPGSPLTYQLARTLDEVSAAARSVRTLADALERDPSAIVRGRAVPKDAR